MIQSMTGFGKAIVENNNASITVEIRSLNSKSADINLRLPRIFNANELTVRNLLIKNLERGKISFTIEYTSKTESTLKSKIDKNLLKQYLEMLDDAAQFVNKSDDSLFKIALGMPNVLISVSENKENKDDWNLLQQGINEAIKNIQDFRKDEGNSLKNALEEYISNIAVNLKEVEKLIPLRKESVIQKIQEQLNQLKTEVNQDRFEQELIYYLEKLDIAEEVVRLSTHLNYYLEELNGKTSGKKLGFISQEIGREINTIGSKANYAPMQKHVVLMKEDLEKIKEQILNVL